MALGFKCNTLLLLESGNVASRGSFSCCRIVYTKFGECEDVFQYADNSWELLTQCLVVMIPRHDDKCDDDLIVCKRCVGALILQISCNEKVMEATDLKARKESSEIELDQLRSSLHAAVAESITAKSFAEAFKARPSGLK
jgi:hypothetical protein